MGEEIGVGAIATVVRISEVPPGRTFAGKILHPRHDRDEAARGRFQREAELASRLRHENLVAVYGIYEVEGRTALLMELVEGETLAARIARRGRLPEDEVVALARGIAAGLAYAHKSGIVHRDLKPANILLATTPQGVVPKIADFGMARAASFADADKRALTVLGTPPYMAPECLEPLAVDPRTDLYALGCIIHEMATGAPPYGGATPFAVLEAHRSAPIPELPADYGEPLRRLTRQLLAKAPGDRPQSASAVVEALSAAARHDCPLVAVGSALPAGIDPDDVASGRCAGCGAEVLQEVRLCFVCGLPQVVVEPGPMSVFVVGPGRLSNKLDSERRRRLLQWLEANAAVGLDPTPLRRRIPRIPFPLITGVSEESARTLMASLERLDVHAEFRRGGRFAHEGLLRNGLRLTGRKLTLVGAVLGVPALIHPIFAVTLFLLGMGLSGPVAFGISMGLAGRPAVRHATRRSTPLPSALQSRIAALPNVVGHITERRHREALRAVVHRVVSLVRSVPPASRGDVEAEMSQAIDLAAVATTRMDLLDRTMGERDFDPSAPHHRTLMHERDMWSARLLDLTATLDALAARRVAAAVRAGDERAQELLDSLRATVEALEEVQRL